MPKTTTKPLRRIQLDVTERQMARLRWCMENSDSMTMAEEIRGALRDYESLLRLRQDGKIIYAEDGNGNRSFLPHLF